MLLEQVCTVPTDRSNGNVDIACGAFRANAVHMPKHQIPCGRASNDKLHAEPMRPLLDVRKQRRSDRVHRPLVGNLKAG